jgi:hypothetical protein
VKRNAVAGRAFDSFAALEAHLAAWVRDIADARVHGTTGEVPRERFAREEAVTGQCTEAVRRHPDLRGVALA